MRTDAIIQVIMNQVVFSTTNIDKFAIAQQVFGEYGQTLTQKSIDIQEIQSEDAQKIANDKASKAFDSIQCPIVVSDDTWSFVGLRGFPGGYMHSMNKWLTSEDFLNLTLPLIDRNVVLTQVLVYKDAVNQRIFSQNITGKLLKELRGISKNPCHRIISMDGDEGLSIAEKFGADFGKSDDQYAAIWHEFARWYADKHL